MNPWLCIVILSGIAGAMVGAVFDGRKAIFICALIPWFGMLAWLLYHEFSVRYRGGGASMWPVAQLFGGTIAAFIGAVAAAVVRQLRKS
jgi:hypothetical protein